MAIKIWKPCNAVTSSSSYSGDTSGCTNFQWQEASNWSDGSVPQQGDDIVFSPNYNYPCVGGPGDDRPFKTITIQKGFNRPIGQTKNPNEPLSLTALQVNFGDLIIYRPNASEAKQISAPIVIDRLCSTVPADYPGGSANPPNVYGPITGGRIYVYDENEDNVSSYYFSGHSRLILFVCKDNKNLSNKTFVYDDPNGRVSQISTSHSASAIVPEPVDNITRHRNRISVTADHIGELNFATLSYANVRASYIHLINFLGSWGASWGFKDKKPFTSYLQLDGIPAEVDSVLTPGDMSVAYSKELFVNTIHIGQPTGGASLIGKPATQGWDWNVPENWEWTHGIELRSGIKAIKMIMSYHPVGRISAESYSKTVGFRIGKLHLLRSTLNFGSSSQFNMTNSRQTMNFVGINGVGAIIDQIYFAPTTDDIEYNGRYLDINVPATSQFKLWHHTPVYGDTPQDLAPHGSTYNITTGTYSDGVSDYSSSSSIALCLWSSSSSSSSSFSSSSSSSSSGSSSSSLSSSSSSSSSKSSSSSSSSLSSSSSSVAFIPGLTLEFAMPLRRSSSSSSSSSSSLSSSSSNSSSSSQSSSSSNSSSSSSSSSNNSSSSSSSSSSSNSAASSSSSSSSNNSSSSSSSQSSSSSYSSSSSQSSSSSSVSSSSSSSSSSSNG